VSSSLFAEWPFASLPSTGKRLREQVLTALLRSQDPDVSSKYNLRDLWSAPLSYESTRKLVGDYQRRLEATASNGLPASWPVMSLMLLGGLAAFAAAGVVVYSRHGSVMPSNGGSKAKMGVPAEFQQYADKMKSLTLREREILKLICSGKQTRAIASALGISPKTVEFHRTNLLHKTEAGTMTHLVQIATRLGYDQGVSLG
jgi:two-component system sensor histidine kinase TtrS